MQIFLYIIAKNLLLIFWYFMYVNNKPFFSIDK